MRGLAGAAFRTSWALFGVALLTRLSIAFWAFGRVPPAADGKFYHVVAQRIADGDGYTWLWPDGAVTYAAHYPVGYPALLGAAYAVFGKQLEVAFILNAFVGALAAPLAGALAAGLVRAEDALRVRIAAGLVVAFSPTLIAYTSALMTEVPVAVLLLGAFWLGQRAAGAQGALGRWAILAALGALVGCATLLRPQMILFGPVIAWVGTRPQKLVPRLVKVALVCAIAMAVVSPWTARNCAKMDRCVFVSANGGWNLLIGTFPEGRGGWAAVDGERVPPECREVFAEAAKDECFGRAGQRRIRDALVPWAQLIPAKLRVTFDYTGAAAESLREAGALSDAGRDRLGALELLSQRLLFVLGLVGFWRFLSPKRRTLAHAFWLGAAGCAYLGPWAWVGHLLFAAFVVLRFRSAPAPVWALVTTVGLTAMVHAVFFGAGRYSIPMLPLWAPLAALAFARSGTFDRSSPSGG